MENAERAWALLKELIRIDTSNPPGNEKSACDVLARFLKAADVSFHIVEKVSGRPNLVARLPGESSQGPLLLTAHLDVVPASQTQWRHPPFEGVEENGILYGRGAIDMKHMAAMCAVLMAEASRKKLKRPLLFAAVVDEEAGCANGSRFLAEEHPDAVRAEYMIGEGGGFTQYLGGAKFYPIGRAEKGQICLRLFFRGSGGHGSLALDSNPVFRLAEVLKRLQKARPRLHWSEPARLFFSSLPKVGSPVLVDLLVRFFPKIMTRFLPFLTNTVSPTRLKGSQTINVIPEEVTCDLDIRLLPEQTPEAFLEEFWRTAGGKLEYEILSHEKPVVSSLDTPLYRHLVQSIPRHDPGAGVVPFLIPGYTDARFFHRLGAQCYGFAPLVMEKVEADQFRTRVHGVDECVSKEAFLKGYRLLEDAVLSFVI